MHKALGSLPSTTTKQKPTPVIPALLRLRHMGPSCEPSYIERQLSQETNSHSRTPETRLKAASRLDSRSQSAEETVQLLFTSCLQRSCLELE